MFLSWGGSLSFPRLVGILVRAGWLCVFYGYWSFSKTSKILLGAMLDYSSSDTVVFDYIQFSMFHTHTTGNTQSPDKGNDLSTAMFFVMSYKNISLTKVSCMSNVHYP